MVTSITALRVHLLRTYGSRTVIKTARDKLNPNTLYVYFIQGTLLSPLDTKVYKPELVDSNADGDCYKFSLAVSTQEVQTGKMPHKYNTALAFFQQQPKSFNIIRTEYYAGVSPYSLFQQLTTTGTYNTHLTSRMSTSLGNYDVIFVRIANNDEGATEVCKINSQFKYTDTHTTDYWSSDIYAFCFLRRYVNIKQDGIARAEKDLTFLLFQHLLYCIDDIIANHKDYKDCSSALDCLDRCESSFKKEAFEKYPMEYTSMSQMAEVYGRTRGGSVL